MNRWKGENVSTTEVERAINKIFGMNDLAVYGVPVPGNEGKAGMAAIVNLNELDLKKLATEIHQELPSYAVPKFLRICSHIPTTGNIIIRFCTHKVIVFSTFISNVCRHI